MWIYGLQSASCLGAGHQMTHQMSIHSGLRLCTGDGGVPAWGSGRVWGGGFLVRGSPGVLQPQPAGPLQLRRVPGQVQRPHAGAGRGRVHHAQCGSLLVLRDRANARHGSAGHPSQWGIPLKSDLSCSRLIPMSPAAGLCMLLLIEAGFDIKTTELCAANAMRTTACWDQICWMPCLLGQCY